MARTGDPDALRLLLGGPDTAWLVARVRGRRGAPSEAPLTGTVALRDPTAAERSAAMRLVGAPSRTGSAGLRVDLAVVEAILRRGPWPAGLRNAVETLTGPVIDHAAERVKKAAAWEAAADLVRPIVDTHPQIGDWWRSWCAAGGLKRAARSEATRIGAEPGPDVAADLVRGAVAVLRRIPADGIPLAVLARKATGDAHGLDATRPLGRLTVAVLRAVSSTDDDDERSDRGVWDAAGVVVSGLTSTVLSVGVGGPAGEAPAGDGSSRPLAAATAAVLDAMRAARAPGILTLEQVRSGGVAVLTPDAVIHVCENPTVVEIVASRWADAGPRTNAPVLVCTGGQPSTAVVELLQRLSASGATVRYHGDFDWAGLRIAQALAARVPWAPWRFEADDYLREVGGSSPSLRLKGASAESPWDRRLATAMAAHGLAIEEEAVARLLADDLITTGGRSSA
jgi:uncharacterized protein (TIGR02679 family)